MAPRSPSCYDDFLAHVLFSTKILVLVLPFQYFAGSRLLTLDS